MKKIIMFMLMVVLALGVVSAVDCGESNTVNMGDSIEYDGQVITLLDVSSTSAVVDVDGTTEIISDSDTEMVGGLIITVDDVISGTSADFWIECVTEVECGESNTLQIYENIEYDGHIVSLLAVSLISVVIEVDGIEEIIIDGDTEMVGGLVVTVDDVILEGDYDESTADIYIECVTEVECGDSNFLQIDENVEFNGQVITLLDVSSSSAVIDVDGITEIIAEGETENIGGVVLTLDSLYLRTDYDESGVEFTVECLRTVVCGPSVTMAVDDILLYEDQIITLLDVSLSSAVIDVDGTTEIIAEDDIESVDGVFVLVESVVSRTDASESSATVRISCFETLAECVEGSRPIFRAADEGGIAWYWWCLGIVGLLVLIGFILYGFGCCKAKPRKRKRKKK